MADYWSAVEPYWNDCPLDDPAAYLRFYGNMPASARDLLTTHWVVSEVCNGGFHQLLTNGTGMLVPEAITAFRAIGLEELAAITAEAAAVFGRRFPREQSLRIAALDRHAAKQGDPEAWNPFTALDDRFYDVLEEDGDKDLYLEHANAYDER